MAEEHPEELDDQSAGENVFHRLFTPGQLGDAWLDRPSGFGGRWGYREIRARFRTGLLHTRYRLSQHPVSSRKGAIMGTRLAKALFLDSLSYRESSAPRTTASQSSQPQWWLPAPSRSKT